VLALVVGRSTPVGFIDTSLLRALIEPLDCRRRDPSERRTLAAGSACA